MFTISCKARIALQGNENNDNFTQLMMLLGMKDESIIKMYSTNILTMTYRINY